MRYFIVLLLVSFNAYSGISQGKVQELFFNTDNNVVTFSLSNPIEDAARCNDQLMFSVDTSRPGGASIFRILLEAKELGYTLKAKGRNLCGLDLHAEDLFQLLVL